MTVLELVEITVYCFYHLFKLLSCSALPGSNELLDDHRALEPPDPIPNSVVKRCIADGSVGSPHVRVGHRQAPNRKTLPSGGVFLFLHFDKYLLLLLPSM